MELNFKQTGMEATNGPIFSAIFTDQSGANFKKIFEDFKQPGSDFPDLFIPVEAAQKFIQKRHQMLTFTCLILPILFIHCRLCENISFLFFLPV